MGKVQKFKPGQGYTRKDWDDVQSSELTDEQMAKAKPFAEVFPDLAASIRKGRGPNKAESELNTRPDIRMTPDEQAAFLRANRKIERHQ